MSITPQDFLESAESMAATDAREVHQRNAISRLYYSAYHRSHEYIAPDGKAREHVAPDGTARKLGMHRNYLEQLIESAPGTTARKLGVSLEVVYSGRIKADYHLENDVQPREFSMRLNRTKDIFTLINTTPQQSQARTTPHLKAIS